MLIDGFAISGYRSFGSEIQKIGPLEKINLIIGQNNSGKSNLLRFLVEHYTILVNVLARRASLQDLIFEDLDRHRGAKTDEVQFGIGLDLKGAKYVEIQEVIESSLGRNPHSRNILNRLLVSEAFTLDTNICWFFYRANSLKDEFGISLHLKSALAHERPINEEEWRILASILTDSSGTIDHNMNLVLNRISPFILKPPQIKLIPTFRRVTKSDPSKPKEYDFSGEGIINELVKLKDPGHNQQKDKERFNNINEFLRNVTENKSANLEIPYHRDSITVLMDGKALPLESLGTGIHQVIMLAVATTVLENTVVCIEEPELHLHPNLQRKLIRYIKDNTNNQYIITTHSAHLLDTSIAAVFHVRYENGQSIVTPVIKSYEKFLVCEDLGYRASDILQSNCIIWVEGPSDRIYLNHWIRDIDNNLIEGVHYSIMFYGGKLLSHLSSEHEDVESFISLRSINRKMCVVMDSDKQTPKTKINDTKQRLKEEFNKGPGFAWITKGKEIENYIDPELIETVVRSIHKDVDKLESKGIYSNLLKYKRVRSLKIYDADKVKIAHKITEQPANLGILDLQENIERLVRFIKEANRIE